MVWLSLFLAAAFGVVAFVFCDLCFVMAKFFIIHGVIAIVMFWCGWMSCYMSDRVKNYILDGTIVFVGYVWAVFMFALAAANLAVVLTMSFVVWVWFVFVGLFGAKVFGFLAIYVAFRTAAARQVRLRAVTP